MDIDTQITRRANLGRNRGFSVLELVITTTVIGIISAFAFLGVNSARSSTRLQTSVRQLASYMEKARLDAVRRHDYATVTFTSPTTYVVHLDFNNGGTASDRTYSFEQGIQIASAELPDVKFNWRGRTVTPGAACVTTFSIAKENSSDGLNVDVSGSGDVTIENQQPQLPNITYTNNINSSSGINTGTGVSGSTIVDSTPCLDVSGEGVSGDTGPPECGLHLSATSVSVRKNGASTASVVAAMTPATQVVASYPSNLTVTPGSQTVSTGSSFSIRSNNTLRGPFNVVFSSQCGTTMPLRVNVTN